MSENDAKDDRVFASDSEEDTRLMMNSMPAAIRAAQGRRLILVNLQRLKPQMTTVVVAVPADWSDAEIKCELTDIYQAVYVDSHDWQDEDDCEPAEGEHELAGDARPGTKFDLIYPVEDEEDEGANPDK